MPPLLDDDELAEAVPPLLEEELEAPFLPPLEEDEVDETVPLPLEEDEVEVAFPLLLLEDDKPEAPPPPPEPPGDDALPPQATTKAPEPRLTKSAARMYFIMNSPYYRRPGVPNTTALLGRADHGRELLLSRNTARLEPYFCKIGTHPSVITSTNLPPRRTRLTAGGSLT